MGYSFASLNSSKEVFLNTFVCLITNSADEILKHFFLLFPRKKDLTLNADCLQRRQLAFSVRSYFLRKCRRSTSVCRLLNLPIAWYIVFNDCNISRCIYFSIMSLIFCYFSMKYMLWQTIRSTSMRLFK